MKRHLLLTHNGISVYCVYRHGNTRDVFMTYWLRTVDKPQMECHPSDFDIRDLPADLVERFNLARHYTIADLRSAVIEAIDRGLVTVEGRPEQLAAAMAASEAASKARAAEALKPMSKAAEEEFPF